MVWMVCFDFSEIMRSLKSTKRPASKAIANGPVGQVLAGPLVLKAKTKFHFTKSK